MSKNIIIVTNNNFPFGGAAANYLRLLYNGLSQEYDIRVILQRGHDFGGESNNNSNFSAYNYEYCGFMIRPNNLILRMLDTILGVFVAPYLILKYREKEHSTKVLIYNRTAYEVILLMIICKVLNIKIINIISEWYEKKTLCTKFYQLPRWWDFLFMMKYANFHFDGLIVFSSFLKNFYISRNFPEKYTLLQPNLVDKEIFKISNVSPSTNLYTIGYCGTPNEKDGINYLIEAFKIVNDQYPNSRLLVIGDNPAGPSFLPNLKKQISLLNLNEQIILTGLVDFSQIPALLKSCNVLALARPSGKFAEAGFPIKVGEYFASKRPVVLTRVGDLPTYLRNYEDAIFAQPNDSLDFANKIIEIMQNKSLCEKVTQNGYKWMEKNLEFKKATKRTIDFLEEL